MGSDRGAFIAAMVTLVGVALVLLTSSAVDATDNEDSTNTKYSTQCYTIIVGNSPIMQCLNYPLKQEDTK